MRKIISILLALGIVLALSVMAVPTAAQPPCTPVAIVDILPPSPPDFCAGAASDYQIGPFIVPATLTAPNDKLSVDFPTGTSLAAVVAAGVTVNTVVVPSVTISGTHIEFPVPVGVAIVGGVTPVTVVISGVVNPAPGLQTLYVDYKLVCCDAVVFDCGTYTVAPALDTLGFHFDFSLTYTGLALDFIPPFKACGQAGFGHNEPGIGDVTDFNLIINDDVLGCAPPCASANFWFVLTKCAAGETVNFEDPDGVTHVLTTADVGVKKSLTAVALVHPWVDIVMPCWIHFSSPGDYEICFYLECPAVPCAAGAQIVADECLPAKAYQWKEAFQIPLARKWNLISLPLVPLVADQPIDDVLDAYAFKSDIVSVWYYDRCGDDWYVYPTPGAGQQALTTMEDGVSYWIRIKYDSLNPAGTPHGTMWVWGTPKPVPPASPSAYPVCDGWNMVGLTETAPTLELTYLWNLAYGAVYSWTTLTQSYALVGGGNMNPGVGYWVSVDGNGTVYPP